MNTHDHPKLFIRTDKFRDGRQVVRVCSHCEHEFGASKQYPADMLPSHGSCTRHLALMLIKEIDLAPDVAATKAVSTDNPPDWALVLGSAFLRT